MGVRRQNNQLVLALPGIDQGESLGRAVGGTETSTAARKSESSADVENLMEEVCERGNLERVLKRVESNRGSPGVDGMKVQDLRGHLVDHWPAIREQLLNGAYRPMPVKRVDIPKPGGGMRQLGVPTVLDRFIQQAVLQVLQVRWDRTFSEHSYGFRPGRSAHQAVAQAQRYIGEGRSWVVDIDLEKFFDRVNHDRLMAQLAKRIGDKAMLKLIRAYLNAGVMEDGLVSQRAEGTPQGGPLSPFLSNVVLDELDRELERRGHCFVRYADDCNIYVYSRRAGERVMENVTRWITRKLKLKVNHEKSAVDRPSEEEVSGVQLHGWDGAEGADSAGISGPVQGAGTGTDPADKDDMDGQDGERAIRLSQGMAGLLWQMPDPVDTYKTGLVDTAASQKRRLETMETGAHTVCRSSCAGRPEGPGRANGWQFSRPVAHQPQPSP